MNDVAKSIEPIVGGYVRVDIGGDIHRIYFEQAGEGLPLLCLHTAGSDSRQFRDLMNDHEILSNFRVVAFDMPHHGKSSPSAGWENKDYALTSKFYMDTILAVMKNLDLEQPIVMGCSMGGRIILHLALEHYSEIRGVIGLQSGGFAEGYYDLEWLYRPDIHGGETCAAIVSGLIGPDSPEKHKWETLWAFMQSGPGVFKGDLHFYNSEGDIRDRIGEIDTKKCPVWLLTGEYDYSCTPEDTEWLGTHIKGAKWKIMEGMGHFPMSEHPKHFLEYLRPVLEELARP
jgi:pimeloyl-ACP methyl ester carboxylesterase